MEKTESIAETMKAQCSHFWIIEPPNGPTSIGVCKWCGEVAEFENGFDSRATPDMSWLFLPTEEV